MVDSDRKNKDFVNVSSYLTQMAKLQPSRRAVVYPAGRDKNGRVSYTHLTFLQLDQESDYLAHGLQKAGISRGTRIILMVKPSLEFFVLAFAILKIGAVYVVVDPRMGIKRMVSCFQESRPAAFIGIPQAHLIRLMYRNYFKTIRTWITLGRRWFWGGVTVKQIRQTPWKAFEVAKTKWDEMAAIIFTTGSTGPAKGVVYNHGNFDAQIRYINSHFNIKTGEVDLPTFPLYALFDPALGMTAVIPDMDPTRPAHVDPRKIIEAIQNHGVTNMSASPALLHRVGRYGKHRGITLPSLKRVVTSGAPIYPSNIQQFKAVLSEDAEIHPSYGATEAMPVTSIGSYEIMLETKKLIKEGYGICVGPPIKEMETRIIIISDDPIKQWSNDIILEEGNIGEIAVNGDLVTKQYFERPEYDAVAKIKDGNDIWHRMGDLGWMDKKGRIWYCGRKSHRVVTYKETLFTIPCEAIFNTHPRVLRSALVGVGHRPNQKPVICIQREKSDDELNKKNFTEELLEIGANNELTENIKTFLFKKAFPMDIRHNSKILREKLAIWAEKKLR
jgi:acyl-CoA synthetase (AMP-forming)/AMP-acid ligase II